MTIRATCKILAAFLFVSFFWSDAFSADLSKKAAQVKMGMSRDSVIALLGPATWASIPGDTGDFAIPDPRIGLYLYWQKPSCPVAVDFDTDMKVIGVDEGRMCFGSSDLPEKFSCKKKDRARFCK